MEKIYNDGAVKRGGGGLKRIELRQKQEHDGLPSFVTKVSAGEAANSLMKKMAMTKITTALNSDNAPAPFNSTEVEDGGVIDPLVQLPHKLSLSLSTCHRARALFAVS